MPETITPEIRSTFSVTILRQTWTEPKRRLTQRLESRSFGAPAHDPARAGRAAVDQHSEDLRRLADS